MALPIGREASFTQRRRASAPQSAPGSAKAPRAPAQAIAPPRPWQPKRRAPPSARARACGACPLRCLPHAPPTHQPTSRPAPQPSPARRSRGARQHARGRGGQRRVGQRKNTRPFFFPRPSGARQEAAGPRGRPASADSAPGGHAGGEGAARRRQARAERLFRPGGARRQGAPPFPPPTHARTALPDVGLLIAEFCAAHGHGGRHRALDRYHDDTFFGP